MQNQFISVIIPVYNSSSQLKTCLDALVKQTYVRHLYEIIVVDNASVENIREVISQFKNIKYVYESKVGSYAARNKGVECAKGEILAFTDADCIPQNDWIEKGVRRVLASPHCGLVAGKIDVMLNNSKNLSIIEFFDKATAFPQKQFVENDRFGATANIFTTRKVFDQVGLFNSDLKSNGDREWGNRVNKLGYKLIYDEEVCVRHPARHRFSQIRIKYARLIGGQHDLKLKQANYSIFEFAKDIAKDFQKFRIIFNIFVFNNERYLLSVESKELNLYGKIKLSALVIAIRLFCITERFKLYVTAASSNRG